jgi:hypothetical protein
MGQYIHPIFVVLTFSSALLYSTASKADGGLLRLRQNVGNYAISVFTSPTPIRAGTVDFSVLVQNADTGEFVPNAEVTVWLKVPGTVQTLRYAATIEAATNRLFKAAVFNLPEAGPWDVEVAVEGPLGKARVAFEVKADERLPHWRELWPWFGWPGVVVALFGAYRLLSWPGANRIAATTA